MLSALRVFLVLLFSLSSSLLILFLTFKTSDYSKEFLKVEIKKSGLYDVMSEGLAKNTVESFRQENDEADKDLFKPFVDELSSSYLQSKAEQAIDDSAGWISGSNQTPPEISFNDLKEKILKKNPGFIDSVKQMEAEMAENSNKDISEMTQEEIELYESMKSNSFSSWMEKDTVIHLKNFLDPVKSIYNAYRTGLYVAIGILLSTFVLILVIPGSSSTKYFWSGLAFLFGFLSQLTTFGLIWLLVNAGLGYRVFQQILGLSDAPATTPTAEKFILFWNSFTLPWFNNYYRLQIISLISFFLLAVVLIVLSRKKPTTRPAIPTRKK